MGRYIYEQTLVVSDRGIGGGKNIAGGRGEGRQGGDGRTGCLLSQDNYLSNTGHRKRES